MYIIFFIFLTLIFFEIYSYRKYKKSIFSKTSLFIPHYYCHFILNSDFKNNKIKIDKNNFRYYRKKSTLKPKLYLSGDCNFFEFDLNMRETLAYNLEKKNISILNPSCPHYSILHQLNRLTFDLKRNIKTKNLLFSASVNDVLLLLNNNYSKSDGSNFYKPFDFSNNLFPKINFFYLRYFLFYIFRNYKRSTYNLEDNMIIKTPWNDLNYKNFKIMENSFNSSNILDTLKIVKFICKEKKINLILSTFAVKQSEMEKYDHRRKILYYLKKINNIFRIFAYDNNIKLIDFEKIFRNKECCMRNKWDYNFKGNKIRCVEILKNLRN